MANDLLSFSLPRERCEFAVPSSSSSSDLEVRDCSSGTMPFDGLLRHGSANNNKFARRRYANHGLVYGDYYLVELGNRLLDMGLW